MAPPGDDRTESARTDPDASQAPNAPEEGDATPGLEEVLTTLVRESTLWPVLIVLVGSLGSLGAALVVLLFVDHNPFAAAALLLLLGMTADLVWRSRRRPGLRAAAAGVGLVWAAALALAGMAVWFGLV